MKIITMIGILICIEFLFYINIVLASKTKTEINMRESIHFSGKLSSVKNNISNKKQSPPMEEESNEYIEENKTDNINSNKKTYSSNIQMSSGGNNNEGNKFLGNDKNNSEKNSVISNLILNSDPNNNKEKLEETDSVNYNSLKVSDMGPGPIFASGWIKYFKIKTNTKDDKISQVKENEQSKNLPKSFNMNMEYEQEKRVIAPSDYNSKSSDGKNFLYDYIQDKFLFYAILMKDSLNIVSSRKGAVKKTYETIDVKFLTDISENYNSSKNIDEGLQEYGYFSEGYCFKINLETPKNESYAICCDEEVDSIF